MTVKFFAYYRDRDFAGCKELSVPAAATLRELGLRLSERYGARFRDEFFTPDGSELGERTIVFINGRNIRFLQGLDTPLNESDTVQIFPVVAGG